MEGSEAVQVTTEQELRSVANLPYDYEFTDTREPIVAGNDGIDYQVPLPKG